MAYCNNCGKLIVDGVKFCSECGAPVISGEKDNTKRKLEYAGKVVKCPSCGMEIPSFTAICPGCGHEINSARIASAINDFTNQINQCDAAIAESPAEEKKGWKSWKGGRRFWWVVLNIFTLCIPLLIYLLLPLLGIGGLSTLTVEEKKKAQLINNYIFPNDRESILEGLLYIKSQVTALTSGKIDRNTFRWIKIWKNKASQLFERAEILFKGDKIAADAYEDILSNEKKAKKALLVKVIIAAAIVALLFIFIFSRSGCVTIKTSKPASPTITENAQTDESKGIYTYQVRNYIGKNLASVGETQSSELVDEYGSGELRIIIVTENGMLIPYNSEIKKEFTIVEQNIEAGTDITIVHLRDDKGKPYSNLVDYQSYDELILYVVPIGETGYIPKYTTILPTFDHHIYHVKDYVGRNAASFGKLSGSNRIDEYGSGELRIVFTSEDGSYVDPGDVNMLKNYIVTAQDIDANTELRLEYYKDDHGEEYDHLIESQNYEEINLTVRKLDDSIIADMPQIESKNAADDSNEYTELTVKYTVTSGGKAVISGYSGDGNHVTIDRKIDGHEVIGIAENAFKDCTTLEKVLFWADIETIGDYAFSGCTALKEIGIPIETTYIGKHAFEGCTNMSSLIIWGKSEIDDYAFAGCESITSLNVSVDTKRIGSHAFDGCKSLESVFIWDDDTIIEKDAFVNCPNLKDRPIQE